MTRILGITDGDDAGAVLLIDGRLVAAVNEERLNRLKMSIGFPRLAVAEVLRLGGVEAQDVDHVAMAAFAETFSAEARPNKGWFQGESSSIARIRNEVASALAKPLGGLPVARRGYRWLKQATMAGRRTGVKRLLSEMGIRAPISYHEHHRCHAIAAFEASGFDQALSLSLDGGGDGRSSHVYSLGGGNGSGLIHELESFDSIGNYYAYVTHLCGFRASIHEGKITGLAASGEPLHKEMFERLIAYQDGSIRNVGRLFFKEAIQSLRRLLPADWEHRDLASSIQTHLEEVGVKYVQHWLQKSGQRKICLSGGVFANVVLNQRIAELPECDAVFVLPPMGDGGLASGAAFSEWRRLGKGKVGDGAGAFQHVYLGPSYDDREIEAELDGAGEPYRKYDEIEETIARLVHDGKVVARFNGGMEYGPRALGNRTILYRTIDPSVNDWLNRRLHRTEFMPFAPACLAGQEEKLFHWNTASAPSTGYMTITLDCTDWMREHCPAVVHIDGTARPQMVSADTNPSFHKVLEHYHRLSGIPVVVNTSFNMHEEPIVCTPHDAVRAYQKGQLDNLAIGSYLLGDPPA